MTANVHITCPSCLAVNRVPREKFELGPKCGKCHAPLLDGQPLTLNQANFAKHLTKNGLPVLVDFWAPWCGPCKMMAPAFEQAAQMLGPKVRLAKVNTEHEPGLAQKFGIQAIPTMILFRNGQEAARTSGAMSAAAIADWARAGL